MPYSSLRPQVQDGDALAAIDLGSNSFHMVLAQHMLGQLRVVGVADLCIVNPDAEWTVEPKALASQGKSTPVTGYELPARVVTTIVDGAVAYQR